RDALSLLEQAAVLGGGKVTDETMQQLLGAPPSEVQHPLADAVAVGDARAVFEIVNRLVQEGQDLRHVTSETLVHFRNLMLAKAAPEQADLLDVADEEADRLRAQAAKFSPAELARVIGLLLAAPTDMRWTPSPGLGAGTSAIDVTAIRAAWGTLIQHLRSGGKAVLPSFLEVATAAAFDGEVLELVFPPDRTFGVAKVEEREAELRAALQELF